MGRLLPDTGIQPRSSARWISYLWELTFKWARFSHANKPTRWVVARYFGRFNKARQDRWVFGDRNSGAYLHKFAWTSIVRHQIVKGAASPDDPALADYWAERRRKAPLPIDKTSRWLLKAQDGRCPICRARAPARRRPATNPTRVGDMAGDHPQDDHQGRHPGGRHAGRARTPSRTRSTAATRSGPALLPAYEPVGLA